MFWVFLHNLRTAEAIVFKFCVIIIIIIIIIIIVIIIIIKNVLIRVTLHTKVLQGHFTQLAQKQLTISSVSLVRKTTPKWPWSGHMPRFWSTVCKTVRPMLSVRCLSVFLSVCLCLDIGVLWPNGWMDQDETWYGGRPRPPQQC